MITQNQRLLSYLRDCGSINPLTAWATLGIYRLGARVFDLRKEGHDIISERTDVTNRFGEKVSVANYRLGGTK